MLERGPAASAVGLLLCGCVAACGGGGSQAASRSASSARATTAAGRTVAKSYRTGDGDVDDEHGKDLVENDDYPLTEYGHVAGAADRRKIVALVKSYYNHAAAGDGAATCKLLDSRLARDPGLTRTVPADRYSVPVHPHVFPGETCARVASKLFGHLHRRLTLEAATLQVTGVRVRGMHGTVMFGSTAKPEQWLPLTRAGRQWRFQALLAAVLP